MIILPLECYTRSIRSCRMKPTQEQTADFFVTKCSSSFLCQSFTCNLKHTLRHTHSNTHWGSRRDNRGIVGSRESESIFRRVYKQLAESTQTQTRSSLLFMTVALRSLALPQCTLESNHTSPSPNSASHHYSHFCLSFLSFSFNFSWHSSYETTPQYICTY